MSENENIPVEKKNKRGRGPTIARLQIAVGNEGEPVEILAEKYTNEAAALKAIESTPIENAMYLVRRIETARKVVARLV